MWEQTLDKITEKIRSWVDWTRKHLPPSGHIPAIDSSDLSESPIDTLKAWRALIQMPEEPFTVELTPWWDWAWDLFWYPDRKKPIHGREQLLACFRDELTSHPSDIATRFTALHFYYSAATLESPMKEAEVSYLRSAFMEDLRTLVSLLPIEECGKNWRTIRWEILNSLAVKDWDRARRLYDYAELVVALEGATILLLRAQFKFLVVFEGEHKDVLRAAQWQPEVFDGFQPVTSAIYESALLTADSHNKECTSAQRQWMRDTRNDLEKVLDQKAFLLPAHRAMLARCCFGLEDFPRAAANYDELLEAETALDDVNITKLTEAVLRWCQEELGNSFPQECERSRTKKDFGPRVYYSIARSCQLAGYTQKALEVLQSWSKHYPEEPGIFLCMADVRAQEGQYQEAYECLRTAVELNPTLKEDTRTKLALALGGTPRSVADLSSLAETFLKDHPQVSQLIDSLDKDLWPAYSQMSDAAREDWRTGLSLLHYFPSQQPSQERTLLESAAEKFAKALERELKARVFGLFRVEVKKNPELRLLADRALSSKETEVFGTYLRNGKLTLGSMAYVLKQCQESSAPILQTFKRWLTSRYSPLIERIAVLGAIVDVRNRAAHAETEEVIAREEALNMPRLCRGIIDAVEPTSK